MNEPYHPMKPLILDVLALCQRTIELAEVGAEDPRELAPLREAVESVHRTLEILQDELAGDLISPALPGAESFGPEAAEDWLFGNADAGPSESRR